MPRRALQATIPDSELLHSEVGLPHPVIGEQFGAGSGERDAAIFEHIGAIGEVGIALVNLNLARRRDAVSEIRLVGTRHPGVRFEVVLVARIVFHIFRTDTFFPFFSQSTPISYGCRPRHREDAVILHGEFELQAVALVVAIDRISGDVGPFFLAPFLRFFCSFVIKEPVTLDHVQSFGVRGAELSSAGRRLQQSYPPARLSDPSSGGGIRRRSGTTSFAGTI